MAEPRSRASSRSPGRREPSASVLPEAVFLRLWAGHVYTRAPPRTHAVWNAQQNGFHLADLAFGRDLENLVDAPCPRRRVPDRDRAAILDLIRTQDRVVIEENTGEHQPALL